MTMLDDDRLASLLARAGAAFDVPGDRRRRHPGPGRGSCRGCRGRGRRRRSGRHRRHRRSGRHGRGHRDRPAALPAPAGDGRVRRLAVVAGRHRVLAVAACVVVALAIAGTVGALLRSPSGPTVTSGLAHPPRGPATPSPETTTTIPHGRVGRRLAQAQHWGAGARSGAQRGPRLGRRSPGHDADRPHPARWCRRPVRQDRADRDPGARGRPWPSGADDDAADRAGRRLRRLRGQLADPVRCGHGRRAVRQRHPAGARWRASRRCCDRRRRSAGRRGSRRRPPTSPGQYVDLQSRITALQDSRQQYLTILAKATTVGDVLAVQEQLDGIQSQIEQLQGQLQVLSERDVVLDADGDRQRGHPAPAARARCPSPGSCGPGTTASAGSWPAWRASSVWPGPCSSRCCAWACCWSAGAPCGAATSGTGLLATLSDRSPPPAGCPGIVTTPMPPDGPAFSLTAIGPAGAHDDRVEPGTAESTEPDTGSRLRSVPVAI